MSRMLEIKNYHYYYYIIKTQNKINCLFSDKSEIYSNQHSIIVNQYQRIKCIKIVFLKQYTLSTIVLVTVSMF